MRSVEKNVMHRWAVEYLHEEEAALRSGIQKAEAPPKQKKGSTAVQQQPPKVRQIAGLICGPSCPQFGEQLSPMP